MLDAFNTLVKPSQEKLEKELGIKHIEVKFIPTELAAKYRSIRVRNKRIVGITLQFDPLGYIAFKESRQ